MGAPPPADPFVLSRVVENEEGQRAVSPSRSSCNWSGHWERVSWCSPETCKADCDGDTVCTILCRAELQASTRHGLPQLSCVILGIRIRTRWTWCRLTRCGVLIQRVHASRRSGSASHHAMWAAAYSGSIVCSAVSCSRRCTSVTRRRTMSMRSQTVWRVLSRGATWTP